jgi:hypothetical protein
VFRNPDAKVPDFGGGVFLAFSYFQKLSYPQPNDAQVVSFKFLLRLLNLLQSKSAFKIMALQA